MSNIASELATAQTALLEQNSPQSVQSNQASNQANVGNTESIDSNQPAGAAQPNKLPYQASHQVELLHLQAEIDALLGQLQNLKQQRLASDPASESQDSEIHALV